MKTIKLKFKTDGGKDFALFLNYANPAVLEEGGTDLITAAQDAIMTVQPFGVTLASKNGSEFIDRNITAIA